MLVTGTVVVSAKKEELYLADLRIVYAENYEEAKKIPAVHRFGESICYDLNKHNFTYEDSIYLSIAQSDNQKTAISGVPDIVGTVISGSIYFLIAGMGITAGVFGTLAAQKAKKKKQSAQEEEDDPLANS